MGLAKILFDSDLVQRLDIEENRRRSASSEARAMRRGAKMRRGIAELEADVGTLVLMCRALLRLLIV
jgi:hypothetical protein